MTSAHTRRYAHGMILWNEVDPENRTGD